MQIVPFLPDHLKRLKLQPAQQWCSAQLDDAMIAAHAGLPAYSAFVDDRPIAAAGLCPQWEGRAIAWAYLAAEAGQHMVAITRAVERFLVVSPVARIEAYVEADFDSGHRWITLLGFHHEGLLRRFYEGRDMVLYARLRD